MFHSSHLDLVCVSRSKMCWYMKKIYVIDSSTKDKKKEIQIWANDFFKDCHHLNVEITTLKDFKMNSIQEHSFYYADHNLFEVYRNSPSKKHEMDKIKSSYFIIVSDEEKLNSSLLHTYIYNGFNAILSKSDFAYKHGDVEKILIQNGVFISPNHLNHLFKDILEIKEKLSLLNQREIRIFQVVATGLKYSDAAVEIGLSLDGLRYHLKNIFTKLNINSKNDIIHMGTILKMHSIEKLI